MATNANEVTDNNTVAFKRTHIRTYSGTAKFLKDRNGKQLDRALAPATDWESDASISINGVKHYRVSINEWVSSTDVFEYQDIEKVLYISEMTLLYDEHGVQSNRMLGAGSTWDIKHSAVINGVPMYQITETEWAAE